ncbi:MAG: GGDEF domain-containing protein, partial [Ruminiclostridium sp.]|nr:GGDEF domain-containing protein [Ruminiclostridium sp.]
YNIIYWCLFSVGVLIVTVSEHLSGKFPYSFLFFLAAVVSVPVVKFRESLIFAAAILVFPVIYGVATEKEPIYYIAVIAVTAAYIWIAAIVRCCYANIRISEHRLEMTEERCTQISRKDTLTGLLNKAGMSAKFEELTKTPDTSISVILIDVDNFRAYNHMYGYAASDGCLYRICNCIKIIAKPYTEFISRFGGDDFVLVLENMNVVDSVKIAEQLRESIETMAQPFGNGIVTVSIGVSGPAKLENADTYSVLLNEADDQLIVAKRSGKNCIGFRGKPFIHESRRPSSGR